jgi:hypothetical protein
MIPVRPSRRIRVVVAAICWALAVACGLFTAAAFAGGGVLCESGNRAACRPQTWLLVLGIVLTLLLGSAAVALHKPRRRREPRYPWDYPG